MAKKADEVSVEESVSGSEQNVVTETPVAQAQVVKSGFDSVPLEKIEDYYVQISSFVEQVNNGSMKKDTAIYLAWKILSEIK